MTSFLTKEKAASQRLSTVWLPAAAPLMTRWAKDVSPTKSRPDYPRPSAVRTAWKSLNGLWEFAIDSSNFDQNILVPFTFEAALSGIGRGKEIHEHVSYRRTFRVPSAWRGKRIILNFGAVDWEAIVLVNGQEIGRHRGGYTPFSFDITDALVDETDQMVEVRVFDPAAQNPHAFGMIPKSQVACQPMGKQLGSVGIWYTRSTGIWQSVWIEPVEEAHISTFQIDSSLGDGSIKIKAHIGTGEELRVKVTRRGSAVASGRGTALNGQAEVNLAVKSPEAWSPEDPNLYDVALSVSVAGQTVDRLLTYTAFRSISIVDGRIALNRKPYMLRAVLDQGYWPDGLYTAPTEEALIADIISAKEMGFNTLRKHAKVEEARYYYLCDKYGLLVAQDMPSSQDLSTSEAKNNYMNEWTETVQYLRNHPCIALWIPFNENWGNPGEFQDEIAEYTRSLDKSRLIVDASGWSQRTKTDIIDHHDYTNNLTQYSKENPTIPQWVGEYGGVALPMDGHTWMKWWGYQSVKTPQKYLAKVRFLTRQITQGQGFSGFCFTQLSDVEQELNGLMTYDRIPKAPVEQFAGIFKE